jgi:hypothetical protein
MRVTISRSYNKPKSAGKMKRNGIDPVVQHVASPYTE